jgi:hypothetical protein
MQRTRWITWTVIPKAFRCFASYPFTSLDVMLAAVSLCLNLSQSVGVECDVGWCDYATSSMLHGHAEHPLVLSLVTDSEGVISERFVTVAGHQ